MGRSTILTLPEMGVSGTAYASYLGPCPAIKYGNGTVVTGKFTHRSDGSELVRLRLEGESEPVSVTKSHPYWSPDREEFVAVAKLRVADVVSTNLGMRQVLSIEPCEYRDHAINLETTEHVYRVGSTGALVHNACTGASIRSWTGRLDYLTSARRRTLFVGGASTGPGLCPARLKRPL